MDLFERRLQGNADKIAAERRKEVALKEDNITFHFKEVECSGGDWIHEAQGRVHWRALVCTV